MKIKHLLALGALFVTGMVTSQAANTTITAWDFDTYTTGVLNNNPAPSTGAGYAFSLGMTNSYGGSSLPSCDVIATAGASTGSGSAAWRVRGGGGTYSTAGSPDGWSSSASIGSQGAQFNVNTLGYTNIQLKFDYYITSAGTAKIQVQYTTDGATWVNDSNIVYTTATYIHTNSTSANTVMGAYIYVTGGSAWYNGITVGFPTAANNNSKFAVRIVNAATGADDTEYNGTANPAGNVRLDNVIVSGLPEQLNNITVWDFDSGYTTTALVNNPQPSFGVGAATSLGMSNNYTADTGGYSLPSCDVTGTPGASTGSGSSAWRVRGGGGTLSTAGNPNSGWSTEAPIGTQGAEFDVSTIGYSEIALTFDLYYTAAAPAQTELEYTPDGVTWINCTNIVLDAGEAAVLVTNTTDPNTVTGVYISQNSGGVTTWLTNITAYFPVSCAGNPSFGVRVVNATTGSSMLSSAATPYNDNSGNWRFDNVAISGAAGYVGGSSAALSPPLLTAATGVTVDSNSFSISFTAGNSSWVSAITNILVGSTNLYTTGAGGYNDGVTFGATNITFSMSGLAVFKTSGNLSITIGATNYSPDTVNQNIGAGAPAAFAFTSRLQAPAGNGGTFVTQPSLSVVDQYGNSVTNLYGIVTATAAGGNWSFGPASGAAVLLTNGVAAYTNLSAANPAAVTGAYITFTLTGAGAGAFAGAATNSATFNLLPPPTAFTAGNIVVEQEDLITKNSTFSMLELNPTNSNQTAPVNIFAVPATGTNALRQSSSGSCGRLALSDDQTLLCFSSGLCGDSTVPDETTENWRGAATYNYQGVYTFQTTYESYGGATADQARSATTVDDTNFFMGDKGGVYLNNQTTNNAFIGYTVQNGANVRSLKSFGGVVYALQQEGGSDPTATVLDVVPQPSTGDDALFPFEGFPIEPEVLDFYLYRSGNNGSNYDVCYYIDGTNATAGAIFKYYFTGNYDSNTGQAIWAPAGFWNTANGGDGLCLATNANGTVDIYYTTGAGGTAGNSVIHVVDNSAWNQPINLIATNTLYTVSSTSSLRGISLAPVTTNTVVAVNPILPIQITPGSAAFTGPVGSGAASFRFAFTNVTGAASSLSVYGTTNLALPFSSWINLGQPVETTPGQYVFTNTAASNSVFFYTISTNN